MKEVRFGILGPGTISSRFAKALGTVEGVGLTAAASASSPEKAEAFARKFGARRAYGNYLRLAEDLEVDAVYVGVTHNFHYDAVRLCLEHGKAVLCEKPMSVNAEEARKLKKLAEEKNVLLMEAMWTRCLPAFRKAKEWAGSGKIGEVKYVTASFCFQTQFDPQNRLFNPKLAGGSLYDTGVYVIELATGILGEAPSDASGVCSVSETGVDDFASFSLRFPCGALAGLSCGVTAGTDPDAVVYGTKGRIVLRDFFAARKCELYGEDGRLKDCFEDAEPEGFVHEVRHFADLYRNGKKESDYVPLSDTVACAEVFDRLRAQWKLK